MFRFVARPFHRRIRQKWARSAQSVTLARLVTYLAILGSSVGLAGVILQRRERRVRAPEESLPAATPATAVSAARSLPPSSASLPSVVAASPTSETPGALSEALCPADMVLVDSTTCATPARKCAEHQGAACKRFEPAACGTGMRLRYCIDPYEYPNEKGMLPAAVVTFRQAEAACDSEGKRLCTEAEWLLACEGPQGFGYPYGNERDATACNSGREVPRVRPEELWEPRDVSPVMARVDARTPSGARAACASPFGVFDLAGNVEEWVESSAAGFHALLGGEYSQAGPACRTVRQMRDANYRYLQTGFRCCRDPLVRVPHRSGVAPTRRLD